LFVVKLPVYLRFRGNIYFQKPAKPSFGELSTLTQGVTAMTEQQREKLIRALDEQAAKNAASPQAARDFLIKTGTYTEKGELAPEFGGPGYKEID
jgi:hypothetical protein